MVKLGAVTLPIVGRPTIIYPRIFAEVPIPGRSNAYREDIGGLGARIPIQGVIYNSVDDFTKLLLHFEWDDGGTVFIDSGKNYPATPYGNAQIDTAQYKFGVSSGLFNGSTSYLTVPDSPDWAFGTDNFTIDFWIRFNALPPASSGMRILCQYVDASNFHTFHLWNNGSAFFWGFIVKQAGTNIIDIGSTQSASLVTTNTWYHIVVVRSGNNFHIFQDGTDITLSGSPDADSIPDINGGLYIGQKGDGTNYFNGWLDELRISKGTARWTSSFTPPTSPYAHENPYSTVEAIKQLTDGTARTFDLEKTGARYLNCIMLDPEFDLSTPTAIHWKATLIEINNPT